MVMPHRRVNPLSEANDSRSPIRSLAAEPRSLLVVWVVALIAAIEGIRSIAVGGTLSSLVGGGLIVAAIAVVLSRIVAMAGPRGIVMLWVGRAWWLIFPVILVVSFA